MSTHKDQWVELLKKQDMPKWEIYNNENDITIKVPEDQDLGLIAKNFPDTIVLLHPEISADNEELLFIVGNSKKSFQFTLHATGNMNDIKWIS